MGQRANYVIVDPSADGGYELYYSHWAANRVPQDLFWGPEHALRFVRAQRHLPDKAWLDTTWAEGGALIDPERKTLLLFGGENMACEIGLRRVYLQMAAAMWPGWAVRWADGGLVELADYVGVAEEVVLATPGTEVGALQLSDEAHSWYDSALTVRWEDGSLDAWGSPDRPDRLLALGSDLVEQARALRAAPQRILPNPTDSPSGGIHIDVAAGQLHVWSADGGADIQWLLRERWGPWHSEWLADDWERHVALAEGAFCFPQHSDEEYLNRLVAMLSNRQQVDGVQALQSSLEAHGGDEVEVNPWAMRDDHILPDESTRDARLAAAVEACRA
jgi:hypothetical protein